MSFLFDWLNLTQIDIKSSLNNILKATTIPQFPRSISVKSLSLGDNPPIFELLDIIALKDGKFKGLFKFSYDGELKITCCSDMEINSLRLLEFDKFTKPSFILADKSTVIPVHFNIYNIKIDSFFTMVYDGKSITVVFKDEPTIDLDIKTSIDELLDKDLFELIKHDALKLATQFLIQDLPTMIHKINILKTELDIRPDTKVNVEIALEGSDVPIESNYTLQKLQIDAYDTLSLKPSGFNDVVQRISLSQVEYQDLKPHHREENDIKLKKRRVIKMSQFNKVLNKTEEPEISISHEQTDIISIPTNESISKTLGIELSDKITPIGSVQGSSTPRTKTISDVSSPTLIEPNNSHLILDDLDTLILNIGEEPDDIDPPFDQQDPYYNLVHPMDILPAFIEQQQQQQQQQEQKNAFEETYPNEKLRPRGPSSNYINLNSDFKRFDLQKFKDAVGKYNEEVLI